MEVGLLEVPWWSGVMIYFTIFIVYAGIGGVSGSVLPLMIVTLIGLINTYA